MTKKNDKFYRVLVTRETTESAFIPVKAKSAEEAGETATGEEYLADYEHLFKVNEGNLTTEAYLGSGEGDVEEVGEDEYFSMQKDIPDDLAKNLYLEARSAGESPSFAVYALTKSSVERILRLQALCRDNGLSECRVSDGPDWSHNDLDLTLDEVVVTSTQFWFTALPGEYGDPVETESVDIDRLLCELRKPGDLYGSDEKSLKEMVEDERDDDSLDEGEYGEFRPVL